MKLNRLVFFNHCNNGDIHVSRQFIKYAMSRIDADEYLYYHKNSDRLLLDIPNLKITSAGLDDLDKFSQIIDHRDKNSTLYLNTWYRVSPGWDKVGTCTVNTLYDLFDDSLKNITGKGIEGTIVDMLPEIDYGYFEKSNIDDVLLSDKRKKVMICNCRPLSGQCHGFAFEGIVEKLADSYPDVLFLLTNVLSHKICRENVMYTPEIINSSVNDLNENSYISTFCDIIVGKSSGPYTFAMTRQNMLSDKTYICFTHYEDIAKWVHPVSLIKSNMAWCDSGDPQIVLQRIDSAISDLLSG